RFSRDWSSDVCSSDLFRLVMAQHVRAQRSLACFRTSRLVVGNPLSRNQQRCYRIDERRFARADVARQQRIMAVGTKLPHAAVKCPPIEDLQPGKPEAGAPVVS